MEPAIYDASLITTTLNNAIVTGYKKGTFVTANFDEDRVNAESNAQGETSWSLNNSKLGTITLTLNQTSAFNKILNGYSNAKKFFPIYVDDPVNKERRGGTQGIVTKIADATYSDGVEARTYTIKVGDFEVTNY
ncbi:phage protein [Rummeliibacillus sp. TYF-LIM-RU47]|uniref:phage structural protein n=1 Tax=Rummeliibacillus sp. TYF-LIM-RU47 TaxID=2608406 RepID=UPI00123C558B|nr:phage protein [Rummeliibacillus sp. TYF-LIM-RU47]